MSFLEVTGISKRGERDTILQNVSFQQCQAQKIAIAGETGSGKSTLLKIIAGLIQPSAGQVFFKGHRVLGPQEKLVAGHPGIAYLSQHFELPAFLRVEQVLRYANSLTQTEAATLYEVCQISHLLTRRTDELSGGEKQRIALARLLTTAPQLLLLDEPFSNLDLIHKNELKTVILDLGEKLGISCILISHDPLDTLSWADHLLVLQQGKLVQQGTPSQIYNQPENEYVAGLFGKYYLLPPSWVETLLGESVHVPEAKSIFVRPESFLVVSGTAQGLVGTVGRVTFFGSYYEAEVLSGNGSVVLRTNQNLKEGASIKIGLLPGRDWFI